jgi:hypothetical protein
MAWLYTGPLGHLAAGLVDWAALVANQIVNERGSRDSAVRRSSR